MSKIKSSILSLLFIAAFIGSTAQVGLSRSSTLTDPCWKLTPRGDFCGENGDHGSIICCPGTVNETEIPAYTTYKATIMECAAAVTNGKVTCVEEDTLIYEERQNWECGNTSATQCTAIPSGPLTNTSMSCLSALLKNGDCTVPM